MVSAPNDYPHLDPHQRRGDASGDAVPHELSYVTAFAQIVGQPAQETHLLALYQPPCTSFVDLNLKAPPRTPCTWTTRDRLSGHSGDDSDEVCSRRGNVLNPRAPLSSYRYGFSTCVLHTTRLPHTPSNGLFQQ